MELCAIHIPDRGVLCAPIYKLVPDKDCGALLVHATPGDSIVIFAQPSGNDSLPLPIRQHNVCDALCETLDVIGHGTAIPTSAVDSYPPCLWGNASIVWK